LVPSARLDAGATGTGTRAPLSRPERSPLPDSAEGPYPRRDSTPEPPGLKLALHSLQGETTARAPAARTAAEAEAGSEGCCGWCSVVVRTSERAVCWRGWRCAVPARRSRSRGGVTRDRAPRRSPPPLAAVGCTGSAGQALGRQGCQAGPRLRGCRSAGRHGHLWAIAGVPRSFAGLPNKS
jgi:hypothetical protein